MTAKYTGKSYIGRTFYSRDAGPNPATWKVTGWPTGEHGWRCSHVCPASQSSPLGDIYLTTADLERLLAMQDAE